MFPLEVVPALDVFERCQRCFVNCFKMNIINHLTFQRFEKAFVRGIVLTVVLSAPTL
jgi:hypothetical protein